jgi:UDP-2,3-diacylglucosamine hydrolase
MASLFISDLHLDAGKPETVRRFVGFVEREAREAEALYILGDLFEAWIGDDDCHPGWKPVIESLAGLRRHGTACHVMHGNRDFLIGRRFATATGSHLLPDHEVVEVYGQRVLLMHGDLLCTDDTEYMAMRAVARNPEWQRNILAKPIEERRALARELRGRSRTENATKPEEIMDVNQGTVERTMREHDVQLLLHGHTHRPAVHRFALDGDEAVRIVLGAWHEEGSVVRWDEEGFRLETVPLD